MLFTSILKTVNLSKNLLASINIAMKDIESDIKNKNLEPNFTKSKKIVLVKLKILAKFKKLKIHSILFKF